MRNTMKSLSNRLRDFCEWIGIASASDAQHNAPQTGLQIRDRAPYYDLEQISWGGGSWTRQEGFTAKEMDAFLRGMSYGAELAFMTVGKGQYMSVKDIMEMGTKISDTPLRYLMPYKGFIVEVDVEYQLVKVIKDPAAK